MSRAYIIRRGTSTGAVFHVRFKRAGERTPIHWGAYPDLDLAERARDYVNGEFAAGRIPERVQGDLPLPRPTPVRRTERRRAAPASVYRMYSQRGHLLYVGAASSLNRMEEHRRSKDWWRDVARIEVEHFDSRAAALDAEAKAIAAERPAWNQIGGVTWTQQ